LGSRFDRGKITNSPVLNYKNRTAATHFFLPAEAVGVTMVLTHVLHLSSICTMIRLRDSLLVCRLALLALLLVDIEGRAAAVAALDSPRNYNGGGKKPINKRTAQEVVQRLGLSPNPEKGYFIETFRDALSVTSNNHSASTAIYYLLEGSAGFSLWHRIDAVEVWHHYAGAPLALSLSLNDGTPVRNMTLGPDVFEENQQPQVVIAAWEWQRVRSLGDWSLVGTTGKLEFVYSGDTWADTMRQSLPGLIQLVTKLRPQVGARIVNARFATG